MHRNGVVLRPELETVTERMKARGFETGAVVSSFPVHSRFGFDQGFDRFEDGFSKGARRRWNQVDPFDFNLYGLIPRSLLRGSSFGNRRKMAPWVKQ